MIKDMDIMTIVRPNIAKLAPYSTARDDFNGEAQVFLDANESAFDNGCNRYPDPRQKILKKSIANIEGIDPQNLFLGNGSDEAIDILMRIFCAPGVNNAVAIAPSYGMYEVTAAINDVELRKVTLNEDFSLSTNKLLKAIDDDTRMVFLCSPNNPSGNSFNKADIMKIASAINGIAVIDEAYIHFSPRESMVSLISTHNNIVVLQTLSKARGMAALRIGMAIAAPEIVNIMSNVKYPYNISQAAIDQALRLLNKDSAQSFKNRVDTIVSQRDRLARQLMRMECVCKVFPSDANFLLVKFNDADSLYEYLASHGIIVRNRSRVSGCENCLRITIGLPEENDRLIKTITDYEKETAYN